MTASASRATPRILIVDGTNTLYRAFFAIPSLRAPDGSPTNAAYGFINTLNKVIREEQPDRAVVVFDPPGKTFRHRIFEPYKAGREATPEDLTVQFPVVRELIAAHRVPVIEVADFEADDVIATLVARAPVGAEITIVSTDKDLMQLVDDRVTLLDGMKDRRIGPEAVVERFGVPPAQLLDLRALVGDPSDNIPGVKGIGAKGAAKLIGEWGSLEELLAHAEEVTPLRARSALVENAAVARLSRELATLRTDAPLPIGWESADWEAAALVPPDADALRELYGRLGFSRLLAALTPGDAPAQPRGSEIEILPIGSANELDVLVHDLRALPHLTLECVFGEAGPLAGDVVAIAIGRGVAKAAVVLVGAAHISLAEAADLLAPLFAGAAAKPWIGFETKRIQVLFRECGIDIAAPEFDVEIAAQLADPAGAKSLVAIAAQYLGAQLDSWEDLVGRGAKARGAATVPAAELAAWAAAQVCAVRALREPLARRLADDGLEELFRSVELPLTGVLGDMERAGVRIDEAGLGALALDYAKQLAAIEAEIHALAGEDFLISSPKQLQHILFEKLALSPIKRTKTGYSTDESVLEQLAVTHALPARILAYRRLAKLLSTYVVALPPLVNERSGRIHPTFHQLGAATGRLSATRPNVQNIPIRSPEGSRIREMFIPADGCLFLAADYSQIELRLLAHYSQDDGLIQAFRRGDDIHRQTAAEVNGIAPDAVTHEQRDRAKAVNFGIIYGLSSFGLANQLGIAAGEAQATIDAYFARYPGVRAFLDRSVEEARTRGFVATLLGRRRYLPDLASRNRTLRTAAERMAANSVLQGSAADLIKKAMVELHSDLLAGGFAAKMILQVHDELVFEAPEPECADLARLVRKRMEGGVPLRVPLVVAVGVGKNWREAH